MSHHPNDNTPADNLAVVGLAMLTLGIFFFVEGSVRAALERDAKARAGGPKRRPERQPGEGED